MLFQLLKDLPEYASYSNPRLVRLWPFAQRRTRGNAAVAVELTTENEEALLKHLGAWWSQHIVSLEDEIGPSNHSDRTQ